MRKASFWTAWMASKWLWCIFQLPEISGLRPGIRGLPQRGEPGEVALLDELQRGAAAGGHVVDLVVEAELLEGAGAVAPAHDGEPLAVGHGLGDLAGAGGEAVVLEDAHGTVPEDG